MSYTTERLAPQFLALAAETFSLRNERLFVVALLLAIAPLWFGPYLPMVDIPQHAAQITALQQILAGNETFTQAFQINWFTPYLLGYLLLYVAALVLPVTVAAQIVVSLAVVSVPVLTGSLLRVSGADERWKWLAIPCGFSFAFYWGFLSFMVAVPFALLFLVQAIHFIHAPTLRRGLFIAAFSIFLFFCHIIVLGFASLAALGYLAGDAYKNRRDLKGLVLKAAAFAAPVPLIAAWFLITYTSEPVAQNAPVVYGSVFARFVQLLIQPSGSDSFSPFINFAVTGSIVLLPFLAGATFNRQPERWLPFALGLLAFLAVPAFVMNTGFFYERLGVFMTPLWLMIWDPPSHRARRLDWIGMSIVLLWAFLNAGRFAAFARETESFDTVMAAVEPGRKVASMVFDNSSPLFAGPVYMHFPAWYQARRLGVVDFNFADFYSQPARYRPDAGPRLNEVLGWYPTEFRWNLHGGPSYDYFVVKANFDVSNAIFKEKRGSVELVARSEWWWLYRNLDRNHIGASGEGAGSHSR